MATQVQHLREIRDNVLLDTESGSAFLYSFNSFYYSFSPFVADLQRENPIFNEFVRLSITPILLTLGVFNHISIDSELSMMVFGIAHLVGFYSNLKQMRN